LREVRRAVGGTGLTHSPPRYKRHRFPPEIVAHAVWLNLRFSPSFRAVEEMPRERGVKVFCVSLRRWVMKFGAVIARGLRGSAYRPGDIGHRDEVRAPIRGRKFWLWRAADQNRLVLDDLLRRRRDAKAARRLLKSLLNKIGWPPGA